MLIGIDASQAIMDKKTGVQWYSHHLLTALLRIIPPIHKVRLYTLRNSLQQFASLPSHWEIRVLKWPFIKGWTLFRLAFELWRNPPDIYFTPGHIIPPLFQGKAVVTIHDLAFRKFPCAYRHPRINDVLHRWNAKRAQLVIVPSKATANVLENAYHVDPLKVKVIPHGYDNALFHPLDKELVQDALMRYHVKSPYIVSVGRIEGKKNIISELTSVEEVRNYTNLRDLMVVLVGTPGFGYKNIQRWIKDHHAYEWVRELGWLPSQDVATLINGAQSLLALSHEEGFGLTVLEALACGTPVIASDIPAHHEVGAGVVRFVDQVNISDICKAIIDTIRNPIDRQLRIDYATRFTWQQAANSVYIAFNQLYAT